MASTLEKYVECPVCFNLFQGPKHKPLVLSCMHTLCRDCYLQIKDKNDDVKCPLCYAVSDITQVRQDFKTKSLVDDYLKEAQGTTRLVGGSCCGICDESRSLVTCICPKCSMALCEPCAKSHKGRCLLGTEPTGDKWGSMQEMANVKEQLEVVKDKVEQRYNRLQRKLRQLDKTERSALKKIDFAEEESLREVREHYGKLRTEVESAKDAMYVQVELEQEAESQKKTNIESHLRKLLDITQKYKDPTGPIDYTQREDILHNINECLTSLCSSSEDQWHTEFLVEVVEGNSFDARAATKVDITAQYYTSEVSGSSNCHYGPQQPTAPIEENIGYPQDNSKPEKVRKKRTKSATSRSQSLPLSYNLDLHRPMTAGTTTNMYHSQRPHKKSDKEGGTLYLRDKEATLDGVAYRLIKYKNEIWCNTSSELLLYTVDCDLIKKIQMQGVDDVRAMVKVNSSSLVVLDAGYHKGSLKLLNNQGCLQKTLMVGKFSDVSFHNHVIYALEREQNIVIALKQTTKNNWEEWKLIQLSNCSNSKFDTLSVFEEEIFISSSSSHSVYVFTLNGILLGQYGQSGDDVKGTRAGILKYPRICARHSAGSVLVADCFNERLQVLSLDGSWKVVKLEDAFGTTWDAVIEKDHLLVLHFFGRKHHIVKYKPNL